MVSEMDLEDQMKYEYRSCCLNWKTARIKLLPRGQCLLSQLVPLLQEGRMLPLRPLLLYGKKYVVRKEMGEGKDRKRAYLDTVWSRRDAFIF